MDFPEIDQFMKKTGLEAEPAFDYLHFLTEPITSSENKRILGLYFPDGEKEKEGLGYLPPSTIILPPDATAGTLLHELGHRYGHYYYNNLTEEFAENYRKAQEHRLAPIYAGSYARKKEVSMERIAQRSVCRGCPEIEKGASKLCAFCEFGGLPVYLDIRPNMVAQVPTITGGIIDAWVEWAGSRVTIVPAGETFSLYVKRWAHNPGGGWWSVCVTAMSADRLMHDADITRNILPGTDFGYPSSPDKTLLSALGAMPNKSITIVVKLWGHPEVKSTPPDINLW